MKKALGVFGVVVLFAMAAAAQDVPRAEAFLGYTYLRANSATNIPAFSANGGGGDFAINFNHAFGFVTDLGIVKNGNLGGFNVNSTVFPFLFGPRYTVRAFERWTPYFQYLLGGAYESSSAPISGVNIPASPSNPIFIPGIGTITSNTAINTRISASQTAFAQALGGGLNIKLSKSLSIRPIALDWMLTRFQNYRSDHDNNQHNIRYSAGVDFTFGAQ